MKNDSNTGECNHGHYRTGVVRNSRKYKALNDYYCDDDKILDSFTEIVNATSRETFCALCDALKIEDITDDTQEGI